MQIRRGGSVYGRQIVWVGINYLLIVSAVQTIVLVLTPIVATKNQDDGAGHISHVLYSKIKSAVAHCPLLFGSSARNQENIIISWRPVFTLSASRETRIAVTQPTVDRAEYYS